MLSVTSEIALQTSSVRAVRTDEGQATRDNGFAALVDQDVASAREQGPGDDVCAGPKDTNSATPPESRTTPEAKPRNSNTTGAKPERTSKESSLAEAQPDPLNAEAVIGEAYTRAAVDAAALVAFAGVTDGEARVPPDPVMIADEASDPSVSDTASISGETALPALVIAAAVPAGAAAAASPLAADSQAGGDIQAGPGAIAAAAAQKVAIEIAASQPALPASTDQAATPAPQIAVDQGPPATLAAPADTPVEAQTTAPPALASPEQPPPVAATAPEQAAAALGEATAMIAEAAKASTIASGEGAGPIVTPVIRTGFVATGKAGPLDAGITSASADSDSEMTLDAALSAPQQPVDPGEPAPDRADKPRAKADEAGPNDRPLIHQQPTATEPRSSSPPAPGLTVAASHIIGTPAATTATPFVAMQLDPSRLTVTTGTAADLNSLAVEISAHARAGNTRFEIRLDPPELGRIDVRLDVDRSGHVTSRLFVEKSETLDLLRRDAPQLQQALQDAGLKTGSNGLQFSLRDQNPQGGQDGDRTGHNAQRLVIAEDEPVAPEIAGRSYGRMSGAGGGIDIRI